MRRVYVARDITEAHIVRALLEQGGLSVSVQGEHLSGLSGEIPFDEARPSLWVEPFAEARARELVEEYEAGRLAAEDSQDTWICGKCGEKIEPQFSTCWNCGTENG